jgi:hypothetical protein
VLILLAIVAVVVVVPVLASGLLFGATPNVGPTPVGVQPPLVVGNPTDSTCTSASAAAGACVTPGDWIYHLTIETSTITFGSVLFKVTNWTGAVFHNPGEGSFALVGSTGSAAAWTQLPSGGLAMQSSWAQYVTGNSSSSPLTNLFTLVIDTGQAAPTTGMGLSLVAVGTGDLHGESSAISLP